jgi:hypothetical protein
MASMSGNLGNNQITKEQLAAIKRIRTEKNLSPDDVRAKCARLFGTKDVTAINSIMGDAFINHLQNGNGDK